MRRRLMTKAAGASALIVATALVSAAPSEGAAPRDGRIAYGNSATGRINTVNPDGSAIRPVTPEGDFVTDPAWSPDGTHLVYSSDRASEDLRLFTIRRDGTGVHQVTGDSVGVQDLVPTFTPDGAGIIYTRCRPDPPGGCALAFVKTNGTAKRMLTAIGPEAADFFANVSPDGARVAFTRFGHRGIISQVWVMRIDGTHAHPITTPRLEAATPRWTPDGRHLLVTSLWVHLGEDVYRMRADGSHLEKLTHSRYPHNAFSPSPSPSGSRIAYIDDRAYSVPDVFDIFVMRADGSNKHRIVSRAGPFGAPIWGTAPLVKGSSSGATSSASQGARALKGMPKAVSSLLRSRGSVQHKGW
jgi:Tol biopolymer transport system component